MGQPKITPEKAAKLMHLAKLEGDAATLEAERIFEENCGGDAGEIRNYQVELIKAGVRCGADLKFALEAIRTREGVDV